MPASLAATVISSPESIPHAEFYAALLGWDTVEASPEWVRLRDPQRERPGLSFQLEPGYVAPAWPAEPGGVQMQTHLDLLVDDLDREIERAIGLGARLEDHQPQDGVRVMRDPYGHVFCLFLPGN